MNHARARTPAIRCRSSAPLCNNLEMIRRARIRPQPNLRQEDVGWVRNPRKTAYNRIYRNTTFSLWSLFK